MRGFDCADPSHGKVHFTGKDDDDLVQSIKAHAATAHPDLTEGQIREMIAGADWVEGDGHLGRERRLGAIRIRRVSGPPKGPEDSEPPRLGVFEDLTSRTMPRLRAV